MINGKRDAFFCGKSALTAEALTPDFHQAYIPVCQQTTGDGLGGPVSYAAKSRMVLPCGYFFALGAPLYGRTGRGGRKACRLRNPVRQPRPVPLTPLGGEVCGSFKSGRAMTTAFRAATGTVMKMSNGIMARWRTAWRSEPPRSSRISNSVGCLKTQSSH